MEAGNPTSAEPDLVRKDNIRFKALDEINNSISKLYDSINDDYTKFMRFHAQDISHYPRQTVGKLIACNKADVLKAGQLVGQLHSEVDRIWVLENRMKSERVDDMDKQNMEGVVSYDMGEDLGTCLHKWARSLLIIRMIFGILAENGEQMWKYWKMTGRLTSIEVMAEGTEEGTDLFHQVLAKRLERFGVDEVEEALNKFEIMKEDKAKEAEKRRKESEALEAINIAREGFREVFDGLKKELEELKEESWELRQELHELKRGEED
ncbi:hypothetical protein V493_03556 [Pseudogymnoascus sp. VKM F-4281 (FW-2241)]|nr:hypothetical protein V493_03556 [Pseudogymnoascus sp. VKM F-4281 (FW-2241)]